MRTAKEIAAFLERAAKDMESDPDQCGCTSYFIDSDHTLSLSVGWMPGYDDKPGKDIAAKDDPTWRLNAAIVKYNPYDCCDLQFMDQPWRESDGEVWDTMITLSHRTKAGWLKLARWYLKEYVDIVKAMEKGELRV